MQTANEMKFAIQDYCRTQLWSYHTLRYAVAIATERTSQRTRRPPDGMVLLQRLASVSTPLNADAVAFCPYEGWEHYLACGCYELVPQESPPQRIGRLALMDAGGSARAGGGLTELCTCESTGVLDCCWLPARWL